MTRQQYIERTAKAMYGGAWQSQEAQQVAAQMADKAESICPFDAAEKEATA